MANNVKKFNLISEGVNGAEGTVFAEINGQRYVLASLKKFKAEFKINNIKKGVLGMSVKQTRPSGWEGTWEASFYYNQSTFRMLAVRYAEEGILPTFNIQVINEDPTSVATIGRQSVTFLDCICESITMALIDVDSEVLEEDVSGTFNGVRYSDTFKDFTTA